MEECLFLLFSFFFLFWNITDEGMTNGPLIFAYLVFGPGKVSLGRLFRPIKAAV
jgi:hypothetical protein